MKPHVRYLVLIAQAVFCLGSVAFGQERAEERTLKPPAPGPWALECSTNPILQAARRCDLRLADRAMVDQKKAEELYLQFIGQYPDDPLVPYIYCRLGDTFTSFAGPELEYRGVVCDQAKALVYFRKAVNVYEQRGTIDCWLIGARVSVAAMVPGKENQVREYIRYYQWLCELPAKQGEGITAGLLRMAREQQHVAAVNMVAVAARSPDLLKLISEGFPEEEPGTLAREKLKE